LVVGFEYAIAGEAITLPGASETWWATPASALWDGLVASTVSGLNAEQRRWMTRHDLVLANPLLRRPTRRHLMTTVNPIGRALALHGMALSRTAAWEKSTNSHVKMQ
jgi:hypothetical protein